MSSTRCRYKRIPVTCFPLSPFRENGIAQRQRAMSNPFGIPDGINDDFDYSKLSPMLGMLDTDGPDYIGGNTVQRKWNERLTHNCAILYLTGTQFDFSFTHRFGWRRSCGSYSGT